MRDSDNHRSSEDSGQSSTRDILRSSEDSGQSSTRDILRSSEDSGRPLIQASTLEGTGRPSLTDTLRHFTGTRPPSLTDAWRNLVDPRGRAERAQRRAETFRTEASTMLGYTNEAKDLADQLATQGSPFSNESVADLIQQTNTVKHWIRRNAGLPTEVYEEMRDSYNYRRGMLAESTDRGMFGSAIVTRYEWEEQKKSLVDAARIFLDNAAILIGNLA